MYKKEKCQKCNGRGYWIMVMSGNIQQCFHCSREGFILVKVETETKTKSRKPRLVYPKPTRYENGYD